jgi:hypothetical protein
MGTDDAQQVEHDDRPATVVKGRWHVSGVAN